LGTLRKPRIYVTLSDGSYDKLLRYAKANNTSIASSATELLTFAINSITESEIVEAERNKVVRILFALLEGEKLDFEPDDLELLKNSIPATAERIEEVLVGRKSA